MTRYLAVDLGAESGRVISGTFDGERVHLTVVHRFANKPVATPDGLHWDVLRLFADVLAGLEKALADNHELPAGIGVDAWGVDYALLDARGALLVNPYHYRDNRTDGLVEEVDQLISPQHLYSRTGIVPWSINTLYQLLATVRAGDATLEAAHTLLMVPDLVHYWLCGEIAVEYTDASTTGMLAASGEWATDILVHLQLPSHMLVPPTLGGTVLAPLRTALRQGRLGAIPVILPATHDTACAVAALPLAPGARRAYLSSGTWSLLGREMSQPILHEEARLAGFTNERGFAGMFCVHANIMGLWLLQECRRFWARHGAAYDYEALVQGAAGLPSPRRLIDVDAPEFLHPDDMPAALQRQLERTGQPVVTDHLELTRVILESLAVRYQRGIQQLERVSGAPVEALHVMGGGARNAVLCQLTADACRRPVLAGPVEATALGNVLIQMIARGEISNLVEARAVAQASTELQVFDPRADADWLSSQ